MKKCFIAAVVLATVLVGCMKEAGYFTEESYQEAMNRWWSEAEQADAAVYFGGFEIGVADPGNDRQIYGRPMWSDEDTGITIIENIDNDTLIIQNAAYTINTEYKPVLRDLTTKKTLYAQDRIYYEDYDGDGDQDLVIRYYISESGTETDAPNTTTYLYAYDLETLDCVAREETCNDW